MFVHGMVQAMIRGKSVLLVGLQMSCFGPTFSLKCWTDQQIDPATTVRTPSVAFLPLLLKLANRSKHGCVIVGRTLGSTS